MSASPTKNLFILGPSHTIRWKWHIRDGVVPSPLPSDQFYGIGGSPVWMTDLLEQAKSMAGNTNNLVLLVPDFRFGNLITLNEQKLLGPLLQNEFTGIHQPAITFENDLIMLHRCFNGLQLWHNHFGKRARYVFWCLFGRQINDRIEGKYINAGTYCHPTFNYQDVIAKLPGLDIIDLSPLLKKPMHEVRRLFIDTSSHPSQIGYLTLNGLLFEGKEVLEAYDYAVATVETKLIELAQKIHSFFNKPVVLTGRSVWLDVLMQTLGATGALKLAQYGLIIAPLDNSPGQLSLTEILQKYPLENCQPIVITAGSADLSEQLSLLFKTKIQFWHNQPTIDWETSTEMHIRGRGETPKFSRVPHNPPALLNTLKLQLPSHAIEQGPQGMPSWSGILNLLDSITSQPKKHNWRIEGDVLITQSNIAFLVGGNHEVLKYATGQLSPTQESLNVFRENIMGRLQYAERKNIIYKHIIFPDKQSVLIEDFPFKPQYRLGDIYIANLEQSIKHHVLWPADQLRHEKESTFYPLDTHMTDHGSLLVLKLMLEAAGIDKLFIIEKIRSRIIEPHLWKGDLGGKITPPLKQKGMILKPDWPQTKFCSTTGFNDGMIDIIVNPRAPVNKVALLFGDSFFRMMLNHLSAAFTKVICLRTRFMHREMIELIEPEYIFTGNAERYLSNVTSDKEAKAFFLYPHLRHDADLNIQQDFLQAWTSVTAPHSTQFKQFLADHNL